MTKILIVDDSLFALGRLKDALEKFDSACEIESYQSGDMALQSIARDGAPDFAIVDYNMPGMNGIELCEKLVHKMPAGRVSILTAESGFEDDAALEPPAGVGVMTKPITETKLAKFLSTKG